MPFSIAISIPPISDLQMGIIRGVLEYVTLHPDVVVFKEAAMPFLPWESLQRWRGDGVIATAETADRAKHLSRRSLPAVSVSGHLSPDSGLSAVLSDNRAIGQAVAEHLLEQGLRRFACVGHFDWYHDRMRLTGFRETVERAGFDCDEVDVKLAPRNQRRPFGLFAIRGHDRLTARIRDLSGPVGICVTHDDFAHEVIQSCHRAHKSVPDEVSIVGVNNYRLICETTHPPISSIEQQAERIGRESAALLHRLMLGQASPSDHVTIPPGPLVVRRSSDFLAIDDTLVRQAVHEIRARCGEGINAQDIADLLPITRRTLDKRFLDALGHTCADEIRRARTKLAMHLLTTTDLQIVTVGLRCGFDSTSGFIRAFREEAGTTPRQYRVQYQSHVT